MADGFVPPPGAKTYYVAENGSDSNPGTEAAPFKTLQKAADTVQGGDTVLVHAGTYAGFRLKEFHPLAGQWVTFKPAPGEKAIIDAGQYPVQIIGSSYLIIDGFEIKDVNFEKAVSSLAKGCGTATLLNDPTGSCKAYAISQSPPVKERNYAIGIAGTYFGHAVTDPHHIIIRNNDIHHVGRSAINASVGANLTKFPNGKGNYNLEFLNNHIHHNGIPGINETYGTYITGTNLVIRGNVLHDNNGINLRFGSSAPANWLYDSIIENNISYNARGPFLHFENGTPQIFNIGIGIDVWHGRGNIVRNNLVYSNHSAGILVKNRDSAYPDKVYNNTVYGNGSNGLELYGSVMAENNIVYSNAQGFPVREIRLADNSHAKNNLIGGTAPAFHMTGSSTETNNITKTDPLFVNAAGADFHLQPNSPAIDKGLTLSEVPNDFDYGARPFGAAYDIGAYEFGTTPCAAPGGSLSTGGQTGGLQFKDINCIPPGNPVDLKITVPPGATGTVFIGGLLPGFTLSAGTPVPNTNGVIWEVPLSAVPTLTMTPPSGFKGQLGLSVSLIPPF